MLLLQTSVGRFGIILVSTKFLLTMCQDGSKYRSHSICMSEKEHGTIPKLLGVQQFY